MLSPVMSISSTGLASTSIVAATTRCAATRFPRTFVVQQQLRMASSSSAFRPRPRPRPTSYPSHSKFNRAAAGAGASLALSLPFSLFGFGGGANAKATPEGVEVKSNSSTLFREVSPAARRLQATTLVFLSVKGEQRHDWQEWIGYFRENGFDVIDANVDASIKSAASDLDKKDLEAKVLADELGSQVKLSMLQRQPLLFLRAAPSPVALVHAHVHARSTVSGLVIVAPKGSESASNNDAAVTEKIKELSSKLGGRVVVVTDDTEGLRESERWLIEKGY